MDFQEAISDDCDGHKVTGGHRVYTMPDIGQRDDSYLRWDVME